MDSDWLQVSSAVSAPWPVDEPEWIDSVPRAPRSDSDTGLRLGQHFQFDSEPVQARVVLMFAGVVCGRGHVGARRRTRRFPSGRSSSRCGAAPLRHSSESACAVRVYRAGQTAAPARDPDSDGGLELHEFDSDSERVPAFKFAGESE